MNDREPKQAVTRKGLRRTIFGFALLIVAGVGCFYLYSAEPSASQAQPATKSPKAIPVQTALVVTRDIPIEQTGLGVVNALTRTDVKVRVSGQLQKLMFAEGQYVKAGDVIAKVDPQPYEVVVDQTQATYKKDIAQVNAAKIDEARAQRLTASGSGTTQAADTAAAQVAIYQATADGDKAAIATAQLNLSYCDVKAPVSGRAGFHTVDEGAIVQTSDATGIVTITQMQPIAVQFTLTQDELPALTAGQAGGNTLPVSVASRDGSKHLADGKLQVIDSQVDSATGMVKLKAIFDNEDLALWPGELVTAKILLSTNHNSTVIPSAAIQNGQTGPYVYIVKSDNRVASVAIKTGAIADGMTTIDGLNVGEAVVISGQSRLADGTFVSVARTNQAVALSSTEKVQ